jgi:glutathione S-transferase
MSDEEFNALAKSKPLRDKFLGEMDKQKGFSIEKLKQAEDSISKTVRRMENPLSQSEYLLGQITLADFAVLPSMIRMEDLGYEFLWKDCQGVAAWMVRMKNRRSYSAAYYEGSLLSQQYTGIREEHQARRALALADSAA